MLTKKCKSLSPCVSDSGAGVATARWIQSL